MTSNQYDLDPHFVKCLGYMYASKTLRKGDPVPLQYMLQEAIFQKSGMVKDYTDFFQSMLLPREQEEVTNAANQPILAPFEESKGSSSDNELELDLFKEDLMCIICNGMDVGAKNRLLECSDCHSLYHQECHSPVVTAESSFDNWVCHNCKEASKKIKLSSEKKDTVTSSSSSKTSSKSSSSGHHHRHSSSQGSSSYKSSSSSSKSSDKHKSSSSKSSSPSHGSSSKSSSSTSSSRNSLQPNINIVSADKRIQIMKKKAASKLQEKRKLAR